MPVFVDSGILLRAVHRADPLYPEVRSALRLLFQRRIHLVTGLQQFAEFWNVSTRPPGERGGFGLPPEEAAARLRRLERGVHVLTETQLTPEIWKSLVKTRGVRGVQVHDARTVALMLTHSIPHLLTLNKSDFFRYEPDGIKVVTPSEFLASPMVIAE